MIKLGHFIDYNLLPDSLVSAFTISSAIHIGSSQIKYVLGVNVSAPKGIGNLFLNWIALLRALINGPNWITLALGLGSIGLHLAIHRIEILIRVKIQNNKKSLQVPPFANNNDILNDVFNTSLDIPSNDIPLSPSSLKSDPQSENNLHAKNQPASPTSSLLLRESHEANSSNLADQGSIHDTNPNQVTIPSANIIKNSTPIPNSLSREISPQLPDALIVMVFITILTTLLSLSTPVVGPIPPGLPPLVNPWSFVMTLSSSTKLTLCLNLIFPALLLSSLSFVMTVAIGKTFPNSHLQVYSSQPSSTIADTPDLRIGNNINNVSSSLPLSITPKSSLPDFPSLNANQEFFALGMSSLISCFMSSYVPCGSLSRSAVLAKNTNAKSPIASVFTAIIVVCVCSFFTSWFERVPLCVLGAVVLTALFNILRKTKSSILKVWKEGKLKWSDYENVNNLSELRSHESRSNVQKLQRVFTLIKSALISFQDFIIWIVTFGGTIILDVEYGLLSGMIFALMFRVFKLL